MNNLGCHLQVANLQREQLGIAVSCRCFFRVFSVLQNVILTTLITAIAICGVRAPAASSEDFDRNRDNGMATIAAQDREANGEAVIQKSAAESDGPDKMDETDLSRAKQMIRKLRNKGFDESRYAEALDLLSMPRLKLTLRIIMPNRTWWISFCCVPDRWKNRRSRRRERCLTTR